MFLLCGQDETVNFRSFKARSNARRWLGELT